MTLTTGRDINGNALLRIKIGNYTAFSYQVNGETLRNQYEKVKRNESLTEQDYKAVKDHVKMYGTIKQKKIMQWEGGNNE